MGNQPDENKIDAICREQPQRILGAEPPLGVFLPPGESRDTTERVPFDRRIHMVNCRIEATEQRLDTHDIILETISTRYDEPPATLRKVAWFAVVALVAIAAYALGRL